MCGWCGVISEVVSGGGILWGISCIFLGFFGERVLVGVVWWFCWIWLGTVDVGGVL